MAAISGFFIKLFLIFSKVSMGIATSASVKKRISPLAFRAPIFLAFAGQRPLIKGAENADCGEQRGSNITDRCANPRRRHIGPTSDTDDPSHRLN